ncbi:MAG: hypothetical protein J6Z46_02640 [Lachnospiraceae bacterium]|nr:hypothetical protein [Lachnospiraceae bacterium]
METGSHFKLSKDYIHVDTPQGPSFGGDQGWLDREKDRGYACGPVAAHDLLLYLNKAADHLNIDDYKSGIKKDRFLFPVINHFGIDGLRLSLGINIAFMIRKMPYRARWGVLPCRMRRLADEMLKNDIPVIFSINTFFSFLKNHKTLKLYSRTSGGDLVPVSHASSHYMMLTALDDDIMTLSSWGRKYYARWSEYEDLVRHHSFFLFSNICYVRKKK